MEKNFDKNLITTKESVGEDVVWHEVSEDGFDVYGLCDKKDGIYSRRIPLDIANTISVGVAGQSGFGSGGRIRFCTNSSVVAIKVEYDGGSLPTTCNLCMTYGFDMYKSEGDGPDIFYHLFRPPLDFDRKTFLSVCEKNKDRKENYYTINFPCHSEVKSIKIGLDKDATLKHGKKYIDKLPVVYYGSSITHGMVATRSGNTYPNMISQKYNLDFINLGFAGNAKGEDEMAEYIASLNTSMIICDYDHNARTEEHLERTHRSFYKIIRSKKPTVPYVMVSKPDFRGNPANSAMRRDLIYSIYKDFKDAGDENVYFIDGEKLLAGEFARNCTTDGTHPNDLGFYRMALVIGKVVEDVLDLKPLWN